MVSGQVLFYSPGLINWGVLQAITVAGLLTPPTLRLPAWQRAILGFFLKRKKWILKFHLFQLITQIGVSR
jgi:uncharacterized membrane protein